LQYRAYIFSLLVLSTALTNLSTDYMITSNGHGPLGPWPGSIGPVERRMIR